MSELDLRATLHLDKLPVYLARLQSELELIVATDNTSLRAPLMRLVRSGGKRLRPALLFATVVSQGKKIDESVIKAAASIELVHLASLVHDDIMDDGKTRWGTPTISSQDGASLALVIGDFLLAKACQIAALISAEAAALVASTIVQLCEGQSRELSDQFNSGRTIDSLLMAVEGKTSALFAASCRLGGLTAGLPPIDVAALTRYGKNFGMSFQLIDDLLDLLSTKKLAGKPVGSDIKSGIYTMPLLIALADSGGQKLGSQLISNKLSHKEMVEILIKNGSIGLTVQKIKAYNNAASATLKTLPLTETKSGLQQLPGHYLDWVLNNMVEDGYKPAVLGLV